jgi:hypothetical protein
MDPRCKADVLENFAQQLRGMLTAQCAAQILRAETDLVRTAVEDQARGLRQELGQ